MKKFGKEYSADTLRKWEFIKECLREGLKDAEERTKRRLQKESVRKQRTISK